MPNYLSLSIGAPRRLSILRANAEKHNARYGKNHMTGAPQDWKGARNWTFASACGLDQGFNGTGRARVPVWYSHDDAAQFRRERFADECEEAPRSVRENRGYYTDCDGRETARGIVARLPHGRFIAGYFWSDNGERVYFGELYDDERDAAQAADGHAETFAEQARDDDAQYQAARDIEREIEEQEERLRECLAMRNHARHADKRDEARETIATIRAKRETLKTEYADYL